MIAKREDFVYTGQPLHQFPTIRNFTHLRVDPSSSSVVEIPCAAFRDCRKLTELDLSEGILKFIKGEAFRRCLALQHVKIPSSVTSLGPMAFYQCAKLVQVELCEGLITIGAKAFSRCRCLERISIPSTTEVINQNAFDKCEGLVNLDLGEGKLEYLGKKSFLDCTSLQRIRIPSTVKEIDNNAFAGCSHLADVELCEGRLQRIGVGSFNGCPLQRVQIPSTVKVISNCAFGACGSLVHVELQEGLEIIRDGAFGGCESLERVRIPSTVTFVAVDAFWDCSSLREVAFCDEIERFVTRYSIRKNWNHGTSPQSLAIYNHLVRYRIPKRLDKLKARRWRLGIVAMLRRVTSKLHDKRDSIDAKLSVYEKLQELSSLLELAIWNGKYLEQLDLNTNNASDAKVQSRLHCGASVIIPNVLSFLLVDKMSKKRVCWRKPWVSVL